MYFSQIRVYRKSALLFKIEREGCEVHNTIQKAPGLSSVVTVDEEKEHRVFGGCLPADDCTAENLFFEITEATQWTKKTGLQHPKKLD